MKTPASKLLDDIRNSAEMILQKIAGKSSADFSTDRDLQLIIERLFTILGEAANRLRRHYPDIADRLGGLENPVAFRNFVIHVYDQIDPAKVGIPLRNTCPSCWMK
ncbi:MAG TPA: HepT-like ribonuclease domain-containing protein [Tepidisphaeraceae bacterium]|jgi:uncharacterized protein with HEPN domain